jgi:hypothetical protein
MKAKNSKVAKGSCPVVKSIEEKKVVPLLSSRDFQNFDHLFPSKDTT